jgi:general secretion pathway protein F
MPDFSYTALANTGKRDQGTLTANSEREVLAILDARGLFPLRIDPVATSTSRPGGKSLRSRYLAQFFGQLADLLRAGVPLLRSLETLERQSSAPVLGDILREVRAKVADGTSLADALGQHPRAFSELTISMIRAGQEGGFLEDVLERIAQFTEHQEDLRSKVVGAMAYPIFLAVAGFVVLNILVIFFVPRFEPIFQKLDEKGELPALTQGIIGISHLFQHNLLAFASVALLACIMPFYSPRDFQAFLPSDNPAHRSVDLGAIFRSLVVLVAVSMPVALLFREQFMGFVVVTGLLAVLFWLKSWMSTDQGRLTLDRFRLHLPSAGKIYLHLALSRFARILGTLLHNGIPILQALRIAKDSTGNRVLSTAIDQAADNLTHGEKLAVPLAACPYFPRDVVEMIAVGEETNQLEKVLINIANALEKRTSRQLELFVRLLEPVMLLIMAAVTLLVVMGLLLPVFKMSSVVQ